LHKAPPGLVIVLNFIKNLVCVHPEPASSENPLIWISIVETYREGEQSAVETVRREVEPFLRSLQFIKTAGSNKGWKRTLLEPPSLKPNHCWNLIPMN